MVAGEPEAELRIDCEFVQNSLADPFLQVWLPRAPTAEVDHVIRVPGVGSGRSTPAPHLHLVKRILPRETVRMLRELAWPVRSGRTEVAFQVVDEESLRDALARLPAGVVLVSTRDSGGFRGLTVTSFTSVSLAPPLVLVCLDRLATARDALIGHGAFTASLLSRGQQFLADRFSGQAPMADPGWRDVPHGLGENELPIIEGAVAWIECRVHSRQEAGDHDVVVGAVTAVGRGGGEPLLHWERGYWGLSKA